MNIEHVFHNFKAFSQGRTISNISIDLQETERPNRFNVVANIIDESGNKKTLHLGHVEKNEFQPQSSERITRETIDFFEQQFYELWELSKTETSSMDQRWHFIKNKINGRLIQ